MAKRKQEVWYTLELKGGGGTLSGPIEGTNTENLNSKLQAKFRELSIQHSLEHGAVLTVRFAPAEVDEFANPER